MKLNLLPFSSALVVPLQVSDEQYGTNLKKQLNYVISKIAQVFVLVVSRERLHMVGRPPIWIFVRVAWKDSSN